MKKWKNRIVASVFVAVLVFSYALQGAAMSGAADTDTAASEERGIETAISGTEPETEAADEPETGSAGETVTEAAEEPDAGATDESDIGSTNEPWMEIAKEQDAGSTAVQEAETTDDPDAGCTQASDVEHAAEEEIGRSGETTVPDVADETTKPDETAMPLKSASEKAAPEPDWTRGGTGSKKDVSDKVSITSRQGHYYLYESRGYGTWKTASYTALLNDSEAVGNTICVDPRLGGNIVGQTGTKVYEMTAPMLVKAFYYGAYGPGKATVQRITGTTDTGTNNIVTHVAAAEIYARLGYAYKSNVGDGFIDTTNKLKEHVKAFVSAIEDLSVPGGYYVYVVTYGRTDQDFGFGSFELVPHKASFIIEKAPNESDEEMLAKIKANSNYSLAGAQYGVYKTRDDAAGRRNAIKTLTINSNGKSNSYETDPGTYYIIETKAPTKGGYVLSNTVYSVTLASNDSKSVEVTENYKYVFLRIIKEPKGVPEGTQAPSLAGAVFNIYKDVQRTKLVGTVTTDASGKSEQLKADADGNKLLIQNYYVTEVKAPEGYNKVGNFSIDTTPALEAEARYSLIDRTVQEPVVKVGVTVVKESGNPDITEGNTCYSLAGAEFGIYASEDCSGEPVDVLVTDEDGLAASGKSLPAGDYWVKEIKAPEGFYINEEVFNVDKSGLAAGVPLEIMVEDTPKTDPAQIRIVKKAANGVKARSLTGTEFTFSYYKGYYDSEEELPSGPERSWTIKTIEKNGEYIARFSDCVQTETFVSGDEFYLDNRGNPTFPLGTVTITETKPADGYENNPDFGGGASMLIGNIVLNSEGQAKFIVVHGMEPVGNSISVSDTPKTPSIRTSAVDELTRSHMAYAGNGLIRIIDTVSYEYLNENTDYTMKGTLMDKATEKPFKDENGNGITALKKFRTGDELAGTVDVTFEFSCSEEALGGKTLVVKEELVPDDTNDDWENIPGAEHWNPDDEEQTIHFPKIGTTLVVDGSGEHVAAADTDVELVDTVAYENLIPGDAYEVTGVLMDKATGEQVLVNGQEVKASAAFIPDTADGTAEVRFTFNTNGFDGKALIAFEVLSCGGHVVAKHEDINDMEQTVVIPGIETNAYDGESGGKEVLAAKDRIVVDEVSYNGLVAGKTYEVGGEVKIKPEGSGISFDDAHTVPSEIVAASGEGSVAFDAEKVTFTPSGSDGEIVSGVLYISFKVDASDLAGEELVVGETVSHNGVELAVHKDINNDNQTVAVPKIGTMLVNKESGGHLVPAGSDVELTDTITYEGLTPGVPHEVSGVLMDKAAGESVLVDGKKVTASATFIPDTADGTAEVTFTFNTSGLGGRSLVAYEEIVCRGRIVAEHKDINDEEQTVHVPEVRTTATDAKDGDHEISYNGTVTIVDDVEYKNAMPGTKCRVSGILMNKSTGKAAKAGGSEIVGEAVFTTKETNGTVKVSFTFDSSKLKEGEYVVFETLYEINSKTGDETVIGFHRDLEDKAQTVKHPSPPGARTGDDSGMGAWSLVLMTAIAGIAGVIFYRRRLIVK